MDNIEKGNIMNHYDDYYRGTSASKRTYDTFPTSIYYRDLCTALEFAMYASSCLCSFPDFITSLVYSRPHSSLD